MKIAIDCRMYSSSGIGKYLEGLLDNLIVENDSYLLIGKSESLNKYVSNRITVLESTASPFSRELLFSSPVKEINKCDLFFTPYVNIPFGIKIPVVSTIHDLIFYDMPEIVPNKISLLIKKFFIKRAVRVSKEIVTVSKFTKKKIQTIFKTDKKITILYNGFDRNSFQDSTESGYINKGDEYVLFIGNLKKNKNLKVLIDAFKILERDSRGLKLIIVGAGTNLQTRDEELVYSIKELKSDRLVFTGFVGDSELKYLIENANYLIQPSLYEGFGIPPLEALISGTNTIISNIEVLKEIYSDFPVTFFNPYDPVELAKLIVEPPKGINKDEIIKLIREKGYLSSVSFKKLIELFNRVGSR